MTTTQSPSGQTPRGDRHRVADGEDGSATVRPPGGQPLAGAALLDRIRVTGRARPTADPELVAGLRSHIDGGTPRTGADRVPLVITAAMLTDALSCPAHAADRATPTAFSLPLACGALVGVLFRQLVATGTIDDALAEGMDALAVDGHRAPLVEWIGHLAPAERAELRAEVERQAAGLRRRWPALDPAWLPRTQECLRVPLSGGVELVSRVDLAIGRPAGAEASVAFVEVTSGCRRPVHRDDRHLHALMETLRSTTPPFAVATYFTRTGELEVDPVTPELLVAAARRCRAGIEAVVSDRDASRRPVATPARAADDTRWCAGCADAPLGRVAAVATIGPLSAAAAPVVATTRSPSVDGVLPVAEDRAA